MLFYPPRDSFFSWPCTLAVARPIVIVRLNFPRGLRRENRHIRKFRYPGWDPRSCFFFFSFACPFCAPRGSFLPARSNSRSISVGSCWLFDGTSSIPPADPVAIRRDSEFCPFSGPDSVCVLLVRARAERTGKGVQKLNGRQGRLPWAAA